jgi:hypothetical protein
LTSKGNIGITPACVYAIRMARIPFTLRIDPKERAALENLSKIEQRPVNQLVNDAIKLYLSQPRHEEKGLQDTLAKLREYRKRDPEFKRAKAEYVDAEASLGHDPLDGEIIEGEVVNGYPTPAAPAKTSVSS